MRKVIAMLLAVCLLACMAPVIAEGMLEAPAGPFTFYLPADASIASLQQVTSYSHKFSGGGFHNDVRYRVVGLTYVYEADEETDPAVMDRQNFFVLAEALFGEKNTSEMEPVDAQVEMPGGGTLLTCTLVRDDSQLSAFSYYYDGAGFLLAVTGACDTEQIGRDIARTMVFNKETAVAEAARYVVVKAATAKIRSVPDISGGIVRTARKGERYQLIRETEEWYVVDVDGRTGYIHKGVSAIN